MSTHFLTPLPTDFRQEWGRVRSVLLRQGEPGCFPFMEGELDIAHRERVLQRPVRSLVDEIEVAERIGRPFIRITMGLQRHPTGMQATGGHKSGRPGSEGGERLWVQEGVGVIRSEADIEPLQTKVAEFQSRIVERALEFSCVGAVRHADDLAYRSTPAAKGRRRRSTSRAPETGSVG